MTPQSPADSLDEGVFDTPLGRDVGASLTRALRERVALPGGDDALSIFRSQIRRAIRSIEAHPRGALLQRLLCDGPAGSADGRPDGGELSVEETMQAINFVFSHVVSTFQGSLAEMLALAPCLDLLGTLKRQRLLPRSATLYVGDTVTAVRTIGSRTDKAADFHLLTKGAHPLVAGVVEVKSYPCPIARLHAQLGKHVARARRGLSVENRPLLPANGHAKGLTWRDVVRVAVVPSTWKLPRTIAWEEGSRRLRMDVATSPVAHDTILQLDPRMWSVTLRWSHEALADEAFAMTFWYMAKVGEVVFAQRSPWPQMKPAEAGQNAVKWALHRVPLLPRISVRQHQRAIALYNIYGYGYALGNSFRNANTGRREALFPQDLDQLSEKGVTDSGCRLF